MNVESDICEKVIGMAEKHGWKLKDDDAEHLRLRFTKGYQVLDFWWSTGTVGTTVNHPTKPRRTLFRKRVSLELLEKILIKPRLHTRRGYYEK